MSEWTSLSCKEDTKARIAELKEDGETQDDVLNKALDALEREEVDGGYGNIDELPQWGSIEGGPNERLEEIEELLKGMDVVSNNQRVLTRIDDLETELKTHFERELRK